jgi:hypothetical protein
MELFFKDDNSVLHENRDMLRRGASDCPAGWASLVRQLFIDIRAICKKHNSTLPIVAQVKSKFGRLCFYLDPDSLLDKSFTAIKEVKLLIEQAENKSESICEITGLPGSLHVKDRWYATLNENIATKHNYTKA